MAKCNSLCFSRGSGCKSLYVASHDFFLPPSCTSDHREQKKRPPRQRLTETPKVNHRAAFPQFSHGTAIRIDPGLEAGGPPADHRGANNKSKGTQ
jgi:hypothetical protein